MKLHPIGDSHLRPVWRIAQREQVSMVSDCLNASSNLRWLESISESNLVQSLDSNSTRLMIYHHDNLPRAFVYLNHLDTLQPKIEEFAILGEGKGFGTKALSALLDYLQNTGQYERVWLHVVVDNHRAIHIYRKMGFEGEELVDGGWTNRLGKNVDIYRFWRPLI